MPPWKRSSRQASSSLTSVGTVEPESMAPPAMPEVELITTLDQLDQKLAEIDAAWLISDDAMRAVFATFRMDVEVADTTDPWSTAYRDGQFELYERISSRAKYSTENELSEFATDPKCPFPYYTKSAVTVGDQLMAIGFIIKTMGLASGASILEFGPGWGNTTIALSRMGYDVTALDIDPNFVQLIKDRAALFSLDTNARVGAFLDAGSMDEQFDAVLFYECFHHCSDHVQLLADLHRVVKPGGMVVLAAEPIFDGFHAPWGLRLDGESLWAIRQNGWLELGFTESYFIEACIREGWQVERHASDVSPLTSIFKLTRLGDVIHPGTIRLPPRDSSQWASADSGQSTQRYTSGMSRIPCPVRRDWSTIEIGLVNPAPRDLPLTVRHGTSVESRRIGAHSSLTVTLAYDEHCGEVTFETETWIPAVELAPSEDSRNIGIGVTSIAFS